MDFLVYGNSFAEEMFVTFDAHGDKEVNKDPHSQLEHPSKTHNSLCFIYDSHSGGSIWTYSAALMH